MSEEQHRGWIWESVNAGGSYGVGMKTGVILQGEIHPCGFCKGTGLDRASNRCPVCHGRETIKINPPVVVCAFCRGSGREQPRSQVTCTACKGKGVVSVKEPIEKCPNCYGRGRSIGSNLYCMTCRGAGVVTTKGASTSAEGSAPVIRRPGGSELEVMEVLYEVGKAGRHGIGGRIHVSASYANYLCKSLLDKGLITRVERDFFALTPAGEAIFEKKTQIKEKKEEDELKIGKESIGEKGEKIEPVLPQEFRENKRAKHTECYGIWSVEK
jgi:DNA-binding MarR family transcriptional regulator